MSAPDDWVPRPSHFGAGLCKQREHFPRGRPALASASNSRRTAGHNHQMPVRERCARLGLRSVAGCRVNPPSAEHSGAAASLARGAAALGGPASSRKSGEAHPGVCRLLLGEPLRRSRGHRRCRQHRGAARRRRRGRGARRSRHDGRNARANGDHQTQPLHVISHLIGDAQGTLSERAPHLCIVLRLHWLPRANPAPFACQEHSHALGTECRLARQGAASAGAAGAVLRVVCSR
jgi:hypothetical protein